MARQVKEGKRQVKASDMGIALLHVHSLSNSKSSGTSITAHCCISSRQDSIKHCIV